ncbi:MAG: sulfotransferase domain-containing protein [Bacteroidota bacterium]
MTKKNSEIYFHVGAERTGTKYMQSKVFPLLKGVHFINKDRYHKVEQLLSLQQYDKYLISYELNFKGQFEQELSKFHKKFPKAKIILILRSQHSWIVSQYKRSVKNGRRLGFNDMLNVNTDDSVYKSSDLKYINKIQFIENLFENAPLVLSYDDMKDVVQFTDQICDYMGVDYNSDAIDLKRKHTSYNEKQLRAIQRVNKRINISREKVSKSPLINFVYRLYIDAIRYTVLYTAKFLPNAWLGKAPIVEKDKIEEVKNFYKEDWQTTNAYIKDKARTKSVRA